MFNSGKAKGIEETDARYHGNYYDILGDGGWYYKADGTAVYRYEYGGQKYLYYYN